MQGETEKGGRKGRAKERRGWWEKGEERREGRERADP